MGYGGGYVYVRHQLCIAVYDIPQPFAARPIAGPTPPKQARAPVKESKKSTPIQQTACVVLILLMFSGACAGSTTCGFKIDRHIILVQQAMREVQRFLHPRLVRTLKASEKRLTEQTLHSVTAFFYLFVALTLFSTFIVCCMGVDFLDSFTGAHKFPNALTASRR